MGVFEAAGLDPAAVVVLMDVVVDAPVLAVVVLDVVADVVLLVVVVDAPVFEVVAEVPFPVVVFDTPVLAVVVVDFCVVVEDVAGACVDPVCARRIAAETKLQTRMTIKRFMAHPFKKAVEGKVPRP
jgi:hypothetical protein